MKLTKEEDELFSNLHISEYDDIVDVQDRVKKSIRSFLEEFYDIDEIKEELMEACRQDIMDEYIFHDCHSGVEVVDHRRVQYASEYLNKLNLEDICEKHFTKKP